jgi:hypothetical protein
LPNPFLKHKILSQKFYKLLLVFFSLPKWIVKKKKIKKNQLIIWHPSAIGMMMMVFN